MPYDPRYVETYEEERDRKMRRLEWHEQQLKEIKSQIKELEIRRQKLESTVYRMAEDLRKLKPYDTAKLY